MKTKLLLSAALSLLFAFSGMSAFAADIDESAVMDRAHQRIRIRKYDKYLKELQDREAHVEKMKKSEAEVKAMDINTRTVYEDELARYARRIEEARKVLEDHKATMTEADLEKIRVRDEEAKAKAEAERKAIAERRAARKAAKKKKAAK